MLYSGCIKQHVETFALDFQLTFFSQSSIKICGTTYEHLEYSGAFAAALYTQHCAKVLGRCEKNAVN